MRDGRGSLSDAPRAKELMVVVNKEEVCVKVLFERRVGRATRNVSF